MSFAVPGRDFKVAYYDKYTGTSITHVLTVLGYQYFTGRENNETEIGSFLVNYPTYVVVASEKEYMWFPTRAKDSVYGINAASTFKIEDIIPDHMVAVQLVIDSIPTKVVKKASRDDLTTIYEDGDCKIFHAKTHAAFKSVASPLWFQHGEHEWERAMLLYSNQIFVLHAGMVGGRNAMFAICKTPTNDYLTFDENGVVIQGAKFTGNIKGALDTYSAKLSLLTA